jgi:hypothetical protein
MTQEVGEIMLHIETKVLKDSIQDIEQQKKPIFYAQYKQIQLIVVLYFSLSGTSIYSIYGQLFL